MSIGIHAVPMPSQQWLTTANGVTKANFVNLVKLYGSFHRHGDT